MVDEGVALDVDFNVAVGVGVEVDERLDAGIWLSMNVSIETVKTNRAIKTATTITLDFFIAFLLALLIYMQIDKHPFVNRLVIKRFYRDFVSCKNFYQLRRL